jgi:hypothetical protein
MTTNNTPSYLDQFKGLFSGMSGWGNSPAPATQDAVDFSGITRRGGKTQNGTLFSSLPSSVSSSVGGADSTGPGWFSQAGIFGGTDKNGVTTNGWGGTALSGAKAFGDMYSSMKQFGLAEDMFDNSKDQFNKNWGAQTKNYNADIEDRQRARVASNAGAYESVGDYMNKNRMV